MGGLLFAFVTDGHQDAHDNNHDSNHPERVVSERTQDRLENDPPTPEHVKPSEDREHGHLFLLAFEEDVDDTRCNPADQQPRLKIERGRPTPHQRGCDHERHNLSRLFELSKHPSANPEDNSPGKQQDDRPAEHELSRVLHGEPVAFGRSGDVVLTRSDWALVADEMHIGEFISRVAPRQRSRCEQHREHQNEPSKQGLDLGHGDPELSLHRSGV